MEFCVVAGRDGPERHHRPGVGAAAEQSHPPQQRLPGNLHCQKRFMIFPPPAGMSLTKLSLAGNNLIIPSQG
jgi:hypothetical protein